MYKKHADLNKFAFTEAMVTAFFIFFICASQTSAQQWTTATNANDIKNTNSGNVGVGTANPDANAKVHVYNAPSVGVDIQSANTGGWARLRLATGTHTYGWFTGDSSQPDAPNKLGLFDYTAGAFRLMVDSSGNFGVGTPTPGKRLEVLAPDGNAARLYRNAGNATYGVNITFALNNSSGVEMDYAGVHGLIADPNAGNGSLVLTTATSGSLTEKMRIDPSGNVGMGTGTPAYPLTVNRDGSNVIGSWFNVAQFDNGAAGKGVNLGYDNTNGNGILASPGTAGLAVWGFNGSAWGERLRVTGAGSVGIGTPSPGTNYKLDVAGDVHVTGNVVATGSVTATYQDVAEWVPSTQKLRAGTVVVLDTTQTNHVLASTKAYDTGVAGVISDSPGVILGQGGDGKVKVATTGRVKIKVDATRAPIRVGDLLVTSEAEGVAMKSIPVDLGGTQIHRPGTIIGKALEPLEKGTGEILVLLSLQ